MAEALAAAAESGPVALAPLRMRDPTAPIPVALSSSLPFRGVYFFSSSTTSLLLSDNGRCLKERPIWMRPPPVPFISLVAFVEMVAGVPPICVPARLKSPPKLLVVSELYGAFFSSSACLAAKLLGLRPPCKGGLPAALRAAPPPFLLL